MEPYRPYVDDWVIQIMGKFPEEEEIIKPIKIELLQIPVLDVNIAGKKSPLQIAVHTTVNSLRKCYMGEAKKILYPEK